MEKSSRKRLWDEEATIELFRLRFSEKYLKLFSSKNYKKVWHSLTKELKSKFRYLKNLSYSKIRNRFYRVFREFGLEYYSRPNYRYFDLRAEYMNRFKEISEIGLKNRRAKLEEESEKENIDNHREVCKNIDDHREVCKNIDNHREVCKNIDEHREVIPDQKNKLKMEQDEDSNLIFYSTNLDDYEKYLDWHYDKYGKEYINGKEFQKDLRKIYRKIDAIYKLLERKLK